MTMNIINQQNNTITKMVSAICLTGSATAFTDVAINATAVDGTAASQQVVFQFYLFSIFIHLLRGEATCFLSLGYSLIPVT